MVTREASTIPRKEPSKRTVAVPLSPTASTALQDTEGECLETTYKSVHTSFSPLNLSKSLKRLKSVQTCSSIDLVNKERVEDDRRTKSQEELRTNGLESEIVRLLEEVELYSYLSPKDKILRDELMKRFNKNGCSFKSDNKAGRSCSSDYEYCDRCSNGFVATQKDGKFKNDINSHKSDFLYSVISEWVNDMPIKNKDFLGRHMDKESVLNTIAKKLKCFMLNFEGNRLKSKIFDYVNEIPIEVHIENKGAYLNRQIDTLLRKARLGFNNRRKGDKKIFNFRKYVQPTESELREYVKCELGNFFDKSHIKINGKRLKELEIELVDVLMDSWDILDNNEELRDEIVYIMMELGRLSYQQAVSYTNVLIRNLKDFFVVDDNIRKENMFIVLQSSCPNSSRQMNSKDSSDFSISGINEKDLETNLDFYMNRLTQQIDEWLTNLGIHEENKNLRQVVVNDLASDIVDRHKYLELNPSSQGTDEEELEHLKYQIFKWINKLVGEENTNTIEHASDLMKRIQSISAPMLTRFGQSNNTNLPACCQEGSKTHAKSGLNVSSQISPKVTSQGGVQTRNVCPGTMNISQMPMFGHLGLGGSMTESLPRPVSANRRYTSPGGYNAGHFTPDYKNLNINPLPMCSSPTVGDFTMESYTRPGSPGRRHSGSGGYNSGYMRPDYNNMNISNMPIFGPTGPGGSMIENPIRYTAERRLSSPDGFTPGLMKTGCPSYQDNMTIDGQSQLIGSRIPLIPETCGASIIPAANVCGGEYSMNLSQVSMFDPRRRMTSTPKNQKMDYQKVFNGPHTYEPQQIQVGSYGMSNATIGGGQNVGYSSPHSSRKPTCCQGVANVGQTIKDQKPGPSGTTQSLSPACCPSKYNSLKPSMHVIEKDFDTYLKQWVKKVPITDASPEEVAQIQELLINNVYKIIAIVKCNPEVLNNSVLYEDLLEEQIDALFEQLSTSSEFMDKNHALKIELIEKITEIEKEIKKSVQASSYRGQLVENIKNNMPGSNKVYDKHDYYSEFNDVKERGDIADNFVLQMYFNDDKVKSNVYKMRVSKGIHDMVKDISESQNLTVNVNATLNSLQGALYNVPIPPEEELKVEANHILLSQEVDQWLTDLPISEPDKIVAAHQRRTLRDGIVRKIYEIESKNIDNCMVERELKEEVLKVIERVPMSSKDININFMVDELINRLKNRPKEVPRRKSVSFNESIINYEDFGRSGMICSSYNDNLNVSYYKVGDERRELGYSPVEQPTPSRYLLPQVGRQIPQLDHNTTEFYTMKVSSVPAHQTYPQTMANQINNIGQGICCNMSQAQQVSAQSCAPANAGTSQQIPCRQPMAQSYQQEAMPDQSLYIPITQSPHANISQAQEISTQPGFLPASPARAEHTSCGQPMLTIQQNQSTPHQSMHVSMPQEPYGNMSQNQQISAHPYRPGSPGSAQQITCGQPMISQLQGQTNGAVPIGNISGSQVLQRSPIQQGAPSSCNVSQQGFHHQTSPLPGPSVFGNTMQVQNPVPASSSGLHTSQIAGPSRMLPSQNLQGSPTFTRSGVTQSSQMAEFGPDPRFLQPGGAQGTATQVTGSQFSTDPVANSTPQRQLQGGAAPPRVAKKRTREIDRDRLEHAARRVDLELSDEEEEDECNCLEKLWRHRRRRPMFFPCDDYDDYAGCYPMRYPFPFFYLKAAKAHDFCKEAFIQTPPNQEKNNEKKYQNVKYSCESIKEDNFKAIQTTVSLITLQTDGRKCVKIRSKSSEDIHDKRDYKEEEILEWWEMYSSRLRVQKWKEKLQRLAEKLKKPGAEEKLRKKIEKYLRRASSQSDLDEVRKEFRKNLPNDLIRKIKKYYGSEQTKLESPIVVFRLEVEKDNLKIVLNKWFENINMKGKDFLGREIDKQDILNCLVRKLEPLIKKRFEYSNEYKNSFKNNILEVVEELPLGINWINKKHYLNSITESLVNELLEINCPLSGLNLNKEVGVDCHLGVIDSNFHPMDNEIRNFVLEELNCFLDDTNIFVSRSKIDKLEKNLTDTFIDALNCSKINLDEINRDVCKIFETICNLAEKQAKYFTDIIIRDLLKTFQSNNYDECVTEITKRFSAGTGPFYVYHAKSKQGKFNQSLEINKLKPRDRDDYSYTKEVTDEIMDWYHNLPYGLHTSQDVSMNKQIIKDLAESIYDGIKSGQISNDVINREVDSWIKKIDVKSNSANVQRLKNKINNIPLRESINKPGTSKPRTKLNEYEEIIDKWFDTVPLNTNQQIGFEHKRQELIKELATLIDKVKTRNITLSSKLLEAKLLEDITDWMVKMPLYRRIDKKNERSKYANRLIPEVLNVKSKNDYSKSKISYPMTRDKSSNKASVEIESSRKRAEDKQITSKVDGEIQTSSKNVGEKESIDTYLQNLRTQIDEWLTKLNLPHVDIKFKEVAVNELANDILDRHKYLKLNTTRRNAVDELEHLKYQIFKWINKVVGEENSETINHADDLMKRIKSIGQCSNNQIEEDKQTTNIRHLSRPDNSQNKIPCIGPKTNDGLSQTIAETEDGNNQYLEPGELFEGLTNSQLYDHYSDIVRKLCFSLPLDVSTPEKEASSLLARKLLYRNIWLQFNKLRQDPDVDNDYALFDFLMEELLDYHLDIMISPENKDTVIPWKLKVLTTLISCLKNLHYNTDTPLTKQLLKGNKHRLAIKERYERQELETKDIFINSTIDSFLRDLNYKEDDPIIASIYRQRLTKTLEKFIAGTVHLGPFNKLKINDLMSACIPLLRNVPFPINDITNEEVEEAMMGQVVDAWYNDLQVPSQVPREIQLYLARKRAILTNKLHQLQKIDIDNELEREMQHEISNYLDNNIIGLLIPDERANINYMAEDLVNRIKNKRKDNISYESFELRVPLHSSFIQQLPPIIEVAAEVHSCPKQPANLPCPVQNMNFTSENVDPNAQFQILNHTLVEQQTVRNVPRPVPTSIPETIGNVIHNNSVCASCTSSAVGKTEQIANDKFTDILNRSAETDNRYVQQGNETNTLFNRNSNEVGYINKSVKPLPRKGINVHSSNLVQTNIPDNGTDTLFNKNAGEINRAIRNDYRSVQPLSRVVGDRMQIREPNFVQAIVPNLANDQMNSRDASTRAMPQSTTSPGVQSRAASTRRIQELNELDLEESEEEYECKCMERFRRRRRRLRCYDGYPRFRMGPSCRCNY